MANLSFVAVRFICVSIALAVTVLTTCGPLSAAPSVHIMTTMCASDMGTVDITDQGQVSRLLHDCPSDIASAFLAAKAKSLTTRQSLLSAPYVASNQLVYRSPTGRVSLVRSSQRIDDLSKLGGTVDYLQPSDNAIITQESADTAATTTLLANISASNAAAVANMAAANNSTNNYCLYEKNSLAAVVGLSGLARAVKIRDDLGVLGFVLPIAFSPCDKVTAIAPKPVITGVTGPIAVGKTATITIAEPNYSGAFTVSSSAPAVATLANSANNTWTVTANGAGTAVITATDSAGNSNTLTVTVPST